MTELLLLKTKQEIERTRKGKGRNLWCSLLPSPASHPGSHLPSSHPAPLFLLDPVRASSASRQALHTVGARQPGQSRLLFVPSVLPARSPPAHPDRAIQKEPLGILLTPPALGFLHLLTISWSLLFVQFSNIRQRCLVCRLLSMPSRPADATLAVLSTDHLPDADPDCSGYTVTEEERDPSRFTIIPRDAVQQSIFKQIHSIPSEQLDAEARPGVPMPHRRTPRGHRPIILVGYNESRSAVAFELTFQPPVTVRVFIPKDSWDRGTCGPENVRAAIQRAYLNALRGDEQPVIVKPTLVSLNLTPLRSLPPNRYVPSRRLTPVSKPFPYPPPPPLPSLRTIAYRAKGSPHPLPNSSLSASSGSPLS